MQPRGTAAYDSLIDGFRVWQPTRLVVRKKQTLPFAKSWLRPCVEAQAILDLFCNMYDSAWLIYSLLIKTSNELDWGSGNSGTSAPNFYKHISFLISLRRKQLIIFNWWRRYSSTKFSTKKRSNKFCVSDAPLMVFTS